MSIPVYRTAARVCMVICTAVVVAVAVAIPVTRPSSPLLTLALADVPAITALLGFRYFLSRTNRRP